MSQLYLDGPVYLGTTAQNTTIAGSVNLLNTTSAAGDIVYADGSNVLQSLPVTDNGVMIGTATAPTWLAPGTNNQVLTLVAGTPAWATSPSDSSAYGFMAFKSISQGPIGSTETVLTNWNAGPYTDPEYDSTGGAFVPATGVFTIPGLVTEKSRWSATVSASFTQSSNNNNAVTDVHVLRLLLNTTVIGSCRLSPVARNDNRSTVYATVSINFEAKGTDQITMDVACKNGGNITVLPDSVTRFGIVRLANV